MKDSTLFRHTPRVVLALFAAAVVVTVVWMLLPSNAAVSGSGRDKAPDRGIPVEVAPVRIDAVVIDVGAVGTLLANESVVIRPEIAGRIKTIHFQEGQVVAKAKRLVALDDSELTAQVAQSKASANLARLNYQRTQDLVAKRIVSQQVYDEAKARLAEAQARLTLDQVRLEKATLRAPFAGVLGVRRVSPGDYVAAGQDIVNLESVNPLKVDLRLPEVYARRLKTAQAVTLRVDAFSDEVYEGEIYFIDPRVDVSTRSLLVRARIRNSERELRPGMFVTATIVLDRHEQAVLIPEQALVASGGDQYVFRVQDGNAVRTKVAVGNRRAGEIEITSGLTAQDRVVIAGHQKLRDGAPVSPLAPVPETSPQMQ